MSTLTPALLVRTLKQRRRAPKPAPKLSDLLLVKLDELQASNTLPADKAAELSAVIRALRASRSA